MRLILRTIIIPCLSFFLASNCHANEQPKQPHKNSIRIAIIIDDLGHNWSLAKKAMDLPGHVTLAILPHTPHSEKIAQQNQFKNKKEVMLHAPMENIANKPLGEGGLTDDMNREVFTQTLDTALQSIPNAKGLNNHMGSLLTQKIRAMSWLMEEISDKQLYFVDSKTIGNSVASEIAAHYEIQNYSRDVFLDNESELNSIHSQFGKLVKLAKKNGQAIGIAHPYKETLDYLKLRIPTLYAQGIKLVFVSELNPKPIYQAYAEDRI